MASIKKINRSIIDSAVTRFAEGLASGVLLLDVGAGSGHYRDAFSKQFYLAIDRGYEQKDLAGLSTVADIHAIPFARNSIDAAICLEVLEHVMDPDSVLEEIFRVLKPGGLAMISTPFCVGVHMQPYDYFRYTQFALSEKIRRAGFELVSIQPRGGFFTLLASLIARFPDELFRGRQGWVKLFKPLVRLISTYSLAPIVLSLDGFDRNKSFTLGYICHIRKP